MLAHVGVPGAAPFVATGLFFVGMAGGWGSYRLWGSEGGLHRASSIGLGTIAAGSLILGIVLPVFLGARPALSRPPTTARLEITSPRPGAVNRGNRAVVPVRLALQGGRIVALTSLRLIPNAGYIHLYLDGSLVSMTTGLDAGVTAGPGPHQIRAEFVAVDHLPFEPKVTATVTFRVVARATRNRSDPPVDSAGIRTSESTPRR
jgi:hypothetical protein